jgi:hypothetical protein
MVIINNNIPGIDLPVWEFLQQMPSVANSYGSCICNDLRGGSRFIYYCMDTYFFRYDTWANTWQRLANALNYGPAQAATNMVFDPSHGDQGSLWLLLGYSNSAYLKVFDIATNTWSMKSVTGLPNTTSNWYPPVSLIHTCDEYSAGADDDALYLIKSNESYLYKYSIANDVWTSVGASRTINSYFNYGGKLLWQPGWDASKLIILRGGDTTEIYVYDLIADTFQRVQYNPEMEIFGTGLFVIPRGMDTSKLLIQSGYGTTAKIFELDLQSNIITPKTTLPINLSYPSVAPSQRMCYSKFGGIEFVYTCEAGLADSPFIRTPLFF